MTVKSLFANQQRLLAAFEPAERKGYWYLVGLSLLSVLLELVGVAVLFLLVMLVIDREKSFDILSNVLGFEPGFVQAITMLSGIFILKNILLVLLQQHQLRKLYGVTSSLSDRVYMEGFYGDLDYRKNIRSAEHMNEITSITNSMPNLIIQPSITAITEVTFMVVAFVILVLYKPALVGLLVMVLLPPAVLLIRGGRKRLDRYGRTMTFEMPKLYDVISNAVFGFTEIRLFRLENKYRSDFEKVRENIYDKRIKSQIISAIAPQRLMEILAVLAIGIMAVYFNRISGNEDVQAVLALFASVAFRMLPSLNRVVSSLNTFNTFANIIDFIPTRKKGNESHEQKLDIGSFESLNIKNLKFKFEDGVDVLDGLDFELNQGEFVGISGESGAGKTTLVNVILGFYKPASGTIEVNGTALPECLSSWQSALAYVQQDAFIQSGDISSNIVFGSPVDEERLNTVLENVRLRQWVNELPDGIHTEVGERGAKISGGQRQRLAMARALYRNAEVFIFDEATNALDEDTRDGIVRTIEDLHKLGKTIIVISHDKSTLKNCNREYLLVGGRLQIT